ncbi:LysR family transcriptional regulator [Lignipirellula cremea]|uniref:HTH-type transcriptional regulator CysB n=1 Tax=Lignipirellula cremea TaxID=2528010 RepID=A0A518E185_9BACT|nr:LysR family transcriptional regulator [Lignipirellula cremea]QDU97850.1 HTH-type transcriptional regulator CysB [Lignipirellula cremea]
MAKKKRSNSNEVRLQQLRSFCETARLGSLTAAAHALGLTQPTIGEQVHALEREFQAQLVEPHGRGCRLTESGRILAELATPLLAGIDSLKASFREASDQQGSRLTIASSPRTLAEDILDCLPSFERDFPTAQVSCLEMWTESVVESVRSGKAHLGLTLSAAIDRSCRLIEVEPGYELDLLLVTPKKHPLARRRTLRLEEIAEFPIVNGRDSVFDPAISEALIKADVFKRHPSRVEATYTAAVRRFVSRGFGVGFVFGLPGQPVEEGLSERSLSRLVGRTRIDLVWRRGAIAPRYARDFADSLKQSMAEKRASAEKEM